MKRLTGAQRKHRQSNRAGNTRSENLARRLREHRRHLRENNLAELTFSTKAASIGANQFSVSSDPPVYGIYHDEDTDEWVLTGLACTDSREVMAHNDRTRRSRTKVDGRYVYSPSPYEQSGIAQSGLEIDRFDRKKDALGYVSAESSSRVESGEYLVRLSHDPRRRTEKVDRDAYHTFQREATRVRDP